MIRLTADSFTEPKDSKSLLDQPLVVHQRIDPTANDKLLIFVHGLGGVVTAKNPLGASFRSLFSRTCRSLMSGYTNTVPGLVACTSRNRFP